MDLLFIGAALGFTISIPPGPVAFEVIKRGLTRSFWVAFPLGFGAALADLVYCSLIFFGAINLITDHPRLQSAIYLLGAILLLLVATVSIIRTHRGEQVIKGMNFGNDPSNDSASLQTTKSKRNGSLAGKIFHFSKRIFLGFTMGFLNPTVIVLFLTIMPPVFAKILSSHSRDYAYLFVIGFFSGVVIWFSAEAMFASIFKKLLNEKVFRAISLSLNGLLIISAGYFIYLFIDMI